MLLKLTHTTDLTYSDLISESVMELRMAPRQEADQHRLSFDLAIGPAAHVTSYFDWLDNTVHTFTVGPFHNQIRIVATSVVETDRPRPEVHRFADVVADLDRATTTRCTTTSTSAGRSWTRPSCGNWSSC